MSNKIEFNPNSVTTPMLVVFIILKLTNLIDWSWWWVLAPVWLPLLLAVVLIAVAMIVSDGDFKIK